MSIYDLIGGNSDSQEGKLYGVYIAIVTNNNDPDGLGRVKLKFPWRETDDESLWARIATLMAGNERGSFFLPEVEDEVLVAFGEGDINNPYVLGALWNGKDKPAGENKDGKNNVRKIKSRSGHEIIFNDDSENKEEKLQILTKSGHSILLDDSSGKEKIEIKDKSGSNLITIDSANNSISMESTTQLKIKSKTIEIEADSMMKLKAGATMTIEGSLVKIN